MADALKINDFLIPASQLHEEAGRIFPLALSLDLQLGGGLVEGQTVILSGVPKSAKSTLALTHIAKCHQMDPDKKAIFFDVESRLRNELLDCIEGLDKDRLSIIRSNKSRLLSAEDYGNLVVTALKDNEKSIVVLDSVAALLSEAEATNQIGASRKMASVATIMYSVFRRVSQILPVTQSTFIAISHLASNPQGRSGKFMLGGNAPVFAAGSHLQIDWKQEIKFGDKPVGFNAKVKIIASALTSPGAIIDVPVIWGRGVCRAMDTLNVGVELKIVRTAGGGTYYMPQFEDDKPKTIRGQEKAIDYLRENPEIVNYIDMEARKMVLGDESNRSVRENCGMEREPQPMANEG